MYSSRFRALVFTFAVGLCSCQGQQECESGADVHPGDEERYRNATCVRGDLTIHDGVDLAAFDALTSVIGSVVLSASTRQQITGFPSLELVDGDLAIVDHPNLENVDGFEKLADVGSSVTVVGNGALESLVLSALEDVGGDVIVTHNDQLQSIELSRISGIAGRLSVAGSNVTELGPLSNLGLLDELELVETGLSTFPVQHQLSIWRLLVRDNDVLQVIDTDLSPSWAIVLGNDALAEVSGFSDPVVALTIAGNGSLRSIEVSGGVADKGRVAIANCDSLERVDMDVAPNLSSAAIYRNDLLSDISWLASVDRVEENLWVYRNAELSQDEVNEAVSGIEVIGSTKIAGNGGDPIPVPGPCPWVGDHLCDESQTSGGLEGTGLCEDGTDEVDCNDS